MITFSVCTQRISELEQEIQKLTDEVPIDSCSSRSSFNRSSICWCWQLLQERSRHQSDMTQLEMHYKEQQKLAIRSHDAAVMRHPASAVYSEQKVASFVVVNKVQVRAGAAPPATATGTQHRNGESHTKGMDAIGCHCDLQFVRHHVYCWRVRPVEDSRRWKESTQTRQTKQTRQDWSCLSCVALTYQLQ